MFTGLIENVGKLKGIERQTDGLVVEIATAIPTGELAIGDSVACDGACLTVVATTATTFKAELSHETVARTSWKTAAVGRPVNLERALKLGDRLGGHIVSGHIDAVGRVARCNPRGRALDIVIHCEHEILRYIVEKGSIAIDGISLTVNTVDTQGFQITLIPHSQGATTLADKRPGDVVNLEADVLGKYVEKLIMKDGKIDRTFLAEHGFLK